MNLTDIRIAVISLILCGLFQQSAAADTIDCDNRRLHYLDWVQKYFELADAVFLGKVLDEETPPRPTRRPLPVPENGASNMAGLLEIIEAGQNSTPQPERLQSATFEIIRTWKGPERFFRVSRFLSHAMLDRILGWKLSRKTVL
jgi:hypothetical protein